MAVVASTHELLFADHTRHASATQYLGCRGCETVERKGLNGTHQLLAYADDVNILVGSAHNVKENAEALLVATKEIGFEVNADKTKYMVMSRDRKAGSGPSVKTDNSSIERVKEFKYL